MSERRQTDLIETPRPQPPRPQDRPISNLYLVGIIGLCVGAAALTLYVNRPPTIEERLLTPKSTSQARGVEIHDPCNVQWYTLDCSWIVDSDPVPTELPANAPASAVNYRPTALAIYNAVNQARIDCNYEYYYNSRNFADHPDMISHRSCTTATAVAALATRTTP